MGVAGRSMGWILVGVLGAVGCGGDRGTGADAGSADAAMDATEAGRDAGADAPVDATSPDGGAEGGLDAGTDLLGCGAFATAPTVTDCGRPVSPAADGTCRFVDGTGPAILLTGTVLTPEEAFVGGQVLVDADGRVACVGCDCDASAAAALRVDCTGATISPGLINAHDHVRFGAAAPYEPTDERYEHRHDWRRGRRGHTRVTTGTGTGGRNQSAWTELRQLLAGTTSMNGSGGADGLLRNLDQSTRRAGLTEGPVDYATFPLDDADGTQREMGCDYGAGRDTAMDVLAEPGYVPHLAEGIDRVASNEFECSRRGVQDLLQDQTAIVHGIGLTTEQVRELATDGVALIWSPRSNTTLYGETARVPLFARLGVRVALGTDWSRTGSAHVLRELKCAQRWSARYWNGDLTPYQLWRMVTVDAAAALGYERELGALAVGQVGDVAVFTRLGETDPYRAVVEAEASDVTLVLRGGEPLYGEAGLMEALGRADCETLDVCGTGRRVCVQRDNGTSLADLMAANADSYGLVFCGAPADEPDCTPWRAADPASFPDPSVNGSTVYTGEPTADDADGDAIPDGEDLCPNHFDPIRPLDDGAQPDADGDGLGDLCDPTPLGEDVAPCALRDPDDSDGDGVADASDVCPGVDDPDQPDADGDGSGDACDTCATGPAGPDGSCLATVYDVKRGVVSVGTTVSLTGLVVTAVAPIGAFLQVPEDHDAYAGADDSGIFVYTRSRPSVSVGDRVDVSGRVNDFYGQTQLSGASLTVTGTATVPAPVEVGASDVGDGGARADALEAVLVRVAGPLSVSAIVDAASAGPGDRAPYNEFVVEGVLRVDDFLYLIEPQPAVGDTYTSLTGVLAWRNGYSKLLPRAASDVGGT